MIKLPSGMFVVLALFIAGCSSVPRGSSASEDVQPKARYLAPPFYPFELHKAGTTGTAVVEFIISESGDVIEAHAVSATHPLFGKAAVAAVFKSKFTPGLKNGIPVKVRMRMPVAFELQ